jgi:hypothetical protein
VDEDKQKGERNQGNRQDLKGSLTVFEAGFLLKSGYFLLKLAVGTVQLGPLLIQKRDPRLKGLQIRLQPECQLDCWLDWQLVGQLACQLACHLSSASCRERVKLTFKIACRLKCHSRVEVPVQDEIHREPVRIRV